MKLKIFSLNKVHVYNKEKKSRKCKICIVIEYEYMYQNVACKNNYYYQSCHQRLSLLLQHHQCNKIFKKEKEKEITINKD